MVVGGRSSGNTQRLVEIAQATGVPTYYVETEQELDMEVMRCYKTVGVTAGASTPHWLISNVVSMLKHDWAYRHGSLAQLWQRLWQFLVKSNLYVALGAGCLSYTSSLLQAVEPLWRYFFVAFCYIYAMHILNNFTDAASKLNDPVQTRFYGRHRGFLLISGVSAAVLALLLDLALSYLAFIFILIMSILGLMYAINIFPEGCGLYPEFSSVERNTGLQGRIHLRGLGGPGRLDPGYLLRPPPDLGDGFCLPVCGRPGLSSGPASLKFRLWRETALSARKLWPWPWERVRLSIYSTS